MSIAAMKQALEHLDLIFAKSQALTRARDVLHEAIQQAEQAQPVAWIYQNSNTDREYLVWRKSEGGRNWRPLYTSPPQFLPLSDLAIADIYTKWDATPGVSMADFARAIEAAHNIKEEI